MKSDRTAPKVERKPFKCAHCFAMAGPNHVTEYDASTGKYICRGGSTTTKPKPMSKRQYDTLSQAIAKEAALIKRYEEDIKLAQQLLKGS
jgi:hypothetical protein